MNSPLHLKVNNDLLLAVFSLEGPLAGLQGSLGNPDNPNWQVSNYSPIVEPFSFLDRLQNTWYRAMFLASLKIYANEAQKHWEAITGHHIQNLLYFEQRVRIDVNLLLAFCVHR